MKRIDLRWAAMAALVFGLGFGASAAASDPGCYSTCQELMNDCRAQAPPAIRAIPSIAIVCIASAWRVAK